MGSDEGERDEGESFDEEEVDGVGSEERDEESGRFTCERGADIINETIATTRQLLACGLGWVEGGGGSLCP